VFYFFEEIDETLKFEIKRLKNIYFNIYIEVNTSRIVLENDKMSTYSQAEKNYGTDWAKEQSRDLQRDVIGRTLLKFRKPSQLRVLFFPGVDAAEVHQVYDPLGIPRENLVGIERDRHVYDHLQSQGLGIQLVKASIEDYVESQDRFDFDVVSLDYIGPITRTQELTLRKILGDSTKNHLVLHCANLLRRDYLAKQHYVCGYGCVDDIMVEPVKTPRYNELIKMRAKEGSRKITEVTQQLENGEDQEFKGLAYTSALAMMYFDPGFAENTFNRMLRFTSGDEYQDILDMLDREIVKGEFEIDPEDPVGSLMSHCGNPPALIGTIEGITNSNVQCELEYHGIRSQDIADRIHLALDVALRDKKFFWERDIEPYSYISESGAPMIGNVVFLSHPDRVVRSANAIALRLGYPKRFSIPDQGTLVKMLRDYGKTMTKFRSMEEVDEIQRRKLGRTFLGNSSKPVLTKQRAIEEFKAGATVEDVRSKYRAIGSKPLSQWKAHVTMGTYDEKPIETDEPVVFEEDSDLDKITKDEAIDLLVSGIPADEIHSAYPTSFSVRQLSSYKAHVTMGTYDKKE